MVARIGGNDLFLRLDEPNVVQHEPRASVEEQGDDLI
jgi:hypothetical protein